MNLFLFARPLFWAAGLVLLAGPLWADDDDSERETAAGVIARYQAPNSPATKPVSIERIEAVPRLFSVTGGTSTTESAAHELPPGEFRVEWSGLLAIPYRGQYVLTARRSTLDNLQIKLEGGSVSLGQALDLKPGLMALDISGVQRSGSPAFEFWWRGPSFADEPIEARHFRHEPAAAAKTGATQGIAIDRGAVLADTLGCFRCHAGPENWSAALAERLTPGAQLPGPRLDGLGERTNPRWVVDWLLNPPSVEAAARMPRLFADTATDKLSARIIAAYLTRGDTPVSSAAPKPTAAAQADAGKGLYTAAGCAACHEVPKVDETGANLISAVPSLTGIARKWKPAGLADFLQDPLATRSHGRMPTFGFTTAEAGDLAVYLLERDAKAKSVAAAIDTPSNAELTQEWRKLTGAAAKTPEAADLLAQVALRSMAVRGCFDCHDMNTDGHLSITRAASGPARLGASVEPKAVRPTPTAPSLVALPVQRMQSGCLAPDAKTGQAPRFALTAADRESLRAYLLTLPQASTASSMDRLRLDLAALNCLRCHNNEGSGGTSLESLLGGGEAALHSMPPMLTGAGERVNSEDLYKWLTDGARVGALRPWVGAKMPGFGVRGARVADELAARDGATGPDPLAGPTAPSTKAPRLQPDHQSIGRTLVGTKALACINCHTLHGKSLASQPDPTTRGPDLDKVAAHLRPEYFQRWMMNPARVRPGTKMPQTIRADGTVPIRSLASLPAGTPLDALWTYLSLGGAALAPEDDSAVLVEPTLFQPAVQRGEVQGVPRGVSMGFGDGTVLFDADKLQTVAAWYDGFIKGSPGPYFGTNWARQGTEPQRFELPVHPLSFQMPGGNWSSFALPLDSDPNRGTRFEGLQVGKSAVRLHYRLLVGETTVHVSEDVRLESRPDWQGFAQVFRFRGLPVGARAALALGPGDAIQHWSGTGEKTNDSALVLQSPLVTQQSAAGLRVIRATGQPEASWDTADPKSPRLISAAGQAGTPLELRVDLWTARNPAEALTAASLALLVSAPPLIDDNFDAPRQPAAPLPLAPAVETPIEPAPTKPTRPVVNHKENSDEFAPVKAKFVRFKITKAEQDQQPGIDELEVYGSDPAVNLGPQGKASASSVISGHAIHQIAHINDGKLGNNNSWISNEAGAGWAQIEWPQPVEVRKVVWARDRTGVCNDRLATRYQVLVSDDGSNWTKVADDSDRVPAATSGILVADASPGYRMEAIPLPFDGCRPSDIEFGDDGSMYAIAMTEGQVYRTRRPPAEHPNQVRWERFASGLYHPVGMAIVDGRIFVATKPEITELVDRDGDGRADEFRTVASGWGLSTGWHEYTFGLAVDRQKNLWFALNTGYFWTNPGYVNPGRWRGSVMKVSFEADRLEQVAKGCRVPNGIARGPGGDIFYTDNQGDWIQSCKLAHVVPGRFYGHPEYKEDALPEGQYPDGRSAIWLPYNLSRSAGGPVCDETAGKFGPFAEQMFVGDVGYGANPGIMRVALEKVDGEYQGACFRFVDNQPHGCVRMKFGPDQQLYMASLTTGLTRMKWDGRTPLAIREINIRSGGKGFVLKFTKPLAAETKLAAQDFRVKRYHYLYTGNYGSPEADVTNVPVERAELGADRQSIVLTLPVETYPIGMVYEINAGKLAAEEGESLVHNEAWYTVHRIPQ